MKNKIIVKDIDINIKDEYISLTDIARYKNPDEPKDVVKNWLRTRNTIEFLGLWESINNINFKGVEFDSFRKESGLNSFTLSPERWVTITNAIGLKTSRGRYGSGTFAHKDIAFEFASWVSAEFKLFLIREYQLLKQNETENLEWNVKRILSKVNYRIHTDAIKHNIVPKKIGKLRENFVYANEADVLNVALFGITAKEWRELNPGLNGNIRDHATLQQLVCLTNLESLNAEYINLGLTQSERLIRLNDIAIRQMKVLLAKDDSLSLMSKKW
ncbi:MAG TPA: KilA-N domain-containing protein [Candidatus Dojkabacteria bacterium]|nr:KilA-N domain-containing protein [Candidatus Dojkabacteria bacterium]